MDQLSDLLNNENVEVAFPEKNRMNRYDKVDKKAVQQKLKTTDQFTKVQKMLEDKDYDGRMEWMLARKKCADELYYKKEFEKALELYLEVLMGLSYEGLNETQKEEMDHKVKLKVLMNMALCSYNDNKNFKALKFLEQAEKVKTEAKIYYIYALVYCKEEMYKDAFAMIQTAIDYSKDKYTEETILQYHKLKSKIAKMHNTSLSKEREMYKGIFDSSIYVN